MTQIDRLIYLAGLAGTVGPQVAERFRVKCSEGAGKCWLWHGTFDSRGRPQFWFRRRQWRAYRFAWLLFRGHDPAGRDVHHKCHNPACINPRHLCLVAHQRHGAWSANVRNGNGGATGGDLPY